MDECKIIQQAIVQAGTLPGALSQLRASGLSAATIDILQTVADAQRQLNLKSAAVKNKLTSKQIKIIDSMLEEGIHSIGFIAMKAQVPKTAVFTRLKLMT